MFYVQSKNFCLQVSSGGFLNFWSCSQSSWFNVRWSYLSAGFAENGTTLHPTCGKPWDIRNPWVCARHVGCICISWRHCKRNALQANSQPSRKSSMSLSWWAWWMGSFSAVQRPRCHQVMCAASATLGLGEIETGSLYLQFSFLASDGQQRYHIRTYC